MNQSAQMLVQSTNLENMMYSSESRIKSSAKYSLCDDIGAVKLSKNKIVFSGKNHELEISHIHEIGLSRQTPSLLGIILGNFVAIPLLYLLFLTNHDVVFFISFIAALNIMFLLFNRRFSWVKITYTDMDAVHHAYFMDGRNNGFFAWQEGSDHLLSSIKQTIFT